MCMRKLRRSPVGDTAAVSPLLIVVIVVIIVIVLVAVAWVVLAEPSDYMNEPTEETIATIDVTYKFDFRNLPGGWHAPESSRVFSVEVNPYDHSKNYNPLSLMHAMDIAWFQEENEFRFTLEIKVTGPNQFSATETYTQDADIGEFSKQTVAFGAKYAFVKDPGSYTVKTVLRVTASQEHAWINEIDDDVIWSDSKVVEVSA